MVREADGVPPFPGWIGRYILGAVSETWVDDDTVDLRVSYVSLYAARREYDARVRRGDERARQAAGQAIIEAIRAANRLISDAPSP